MKVSLAEIVRLATADEGDTETDVVHRLNDVVSKFVERYP